MKADPVEAAMAKLLPERQLKTMGTPQADMAQLLKYEAEKCKDLDPEEA